MNRPTISLFTLLLLAPLAVEGSFSINLKQGDTGPEVRELQEFLNRDPDTRVALTGPGSPGLETDYFGSRTKTAVIRFQEKYRSDVLLPVGLSAGSGFVGLQTRAKMLALDTMNEGFRSAKSDGSGAPEKLVPSEAVGATSPAYSSPLPPAIQGVYPSEVRVGDTVTIIGNGFTPYGNNVTIATGPVSRTFENLPSPDGKTITFTYQQVDDAPLTVSEFEALPLDVQKVVEDTFSKAGVTVEQMARPYKGISDETELDAFLRRNGSSLRELDLQYHVLVENKNGSVMSGGVALRAARKFEFQSTFSFLKEEILVPIGKTLSLYPETARAQVPGGGLHVSLIYYCTCGSGHLSIFIDMAGSGTGLWYFPAGFIPTVGSIYGPAFWLGYFTPQGGQCSITIGYGCITLPGNLPTLPYGQSN